MTDLVRLGLALVGFAAAVIAVGVLLGLSGAWIKREKMRASAASVQGAARAALRDSRQGM